MTIKLKLFTFQFYFTEATILLCGGHTLSDTLAGLDRTASSGFS